MLILNDSSVSKNFVYGALFDDLSFKLNEEEAVSIIGANGCRKSTLLKMIAKIEKYDKGSISVKKGAKVVYLDQASPDKHDDRLVEDILKDAYIDLFKIQNKIDDILRKIENEKDSSNYDCLVNDYGKLQEEFQNNG